MLPEPFSRCKALEGSLTRTMQAAQECLSHYVHRLVLARLSGASWRSVAQLVRFVNLSRQLSCATIAGIKTLTSLLEEADSRRPKVSSAPGEGGDAATGNKLSLADLVATDPDNPDQADFWAGKKWNDHHKTASRCQAIVSKHLTMGPGAYFGDRALLEKPVTEGLTAVAALNAVDETQHRVGCRVKLALTDWLLRRSDVLCVSGGTGGSNNTVHRGKGMADSQTHQCTPPTRAILILQ